MGAAPRAAAAAPSPLSLFRLSPLPCLFSPASFRLLFFVCLPPPASALLFALFASVFSVSSQTLLLLRGVNGQFSHQARMARRLQQT
jgi:hypothetical protein